MSASTPATCATRGSALCAAILIAWFATCATGVAADKFKPFKLKNLNGSTTTLADVSRKATLVVFFFPSCPYCNVALPEIYKLYQTYNGQGLEMVWINVLPEEDRKVPAWKTTHGYDVPILFGGQSIQSAYRLTMTPTHYLLDAKAEILASHAGYQPGDEQVLERDIRAALAR